MPKHKEHLANILTNPLLAQLPDVQQHHWPHQDLCCPVSNEGIWKDLLHCSDPSLIHLFIAGSYTPWLHLLNLDVDGVMVELWWVLWVLATLGILYQQLFHEKYKALNVCGDCHNVLFGSLPPPCIL